MSTPDQHTDLPRRDEPGYADPQHQDAQYADQQHPDAQYPDQQYADQQHPDAQYPDQQHPDAQYPDQQYPDQQHPDALHPDQRHPDQHPDQHPDPVRPDPSAEGTLPAEPRHNGAAEDVGHPEGAGAVGSGHAGTTGGTSTDAEGRERLVSTDRVESYGSRWDSIKGTFVDEPRRAVAEADALVGELLQELETLFREQRREIEHGLDADETSTEDLRLALRRYRSFFDRLLTL